ncbi:hypothetical protein [Kitasatospora sp. NPDC058218]|uniref:hypothetical protein n=1 Tax=Kitasatospora sp. NPDC058218 TaxID=3346385 RepID=UPI0036DCC9D4
MLVPGFTAEVVLSAAGGTYRTVSDRSAGRPGTSVTPSAAIGIGEGCIQGCVCVVAEGCPCCDVVATKQPDIRESTVTRRPAGNRFNGAYAKKA